jgi:hypothetical protein
MSDSPNYPRSWKWGPGFLAFIVVFIAGSSSQPVFSLCLFLITFLIGKLVVRRWILKLERERQDKLNSEAWEILIHFEKGAESCPKFVLYLRSFASSGDLFVCRSYDRIYGIPEEEYDVCEVNEFELLLRDNLFPTKIISIGEVKKCLGSGRIHCKEEEWQTIAARAIERANAILIIPSHTAGLLWELDQIVLTGNLKKCLFIIPPVEIDQQNLFETGSFYAKHGLKMLDIISVINSKKKYVGAVFKFGNEKDLLFLYPFIVIGNFIYIYKSNHIDIIGNCINMGNFDPHDKGYINPFEGVISGWLGQPFRIKLNNVIFQLAESCTKNPLLPSELRTRLSELKM